MRDKIISVCGGAPRHDRGKWERAARCRFRALRAASGLSQLGWSVAAGVGVSSVEDWERGAVRVPGWALELAASLAGGEWRAAA